MMLDGDGPSMTYAEKLSKAKEFLGKNWVLHPEYTPNPKHSNVGISTGKFKALTLEQKECQ